MPNFSSLQQFFDTVTARLTKPRRGVGGSEGVVAADVLESLKDVARYADDARASINVLNATVYVRGDVGDDARSGETSAGTGTNGAVRSLARAVELHTGYRQTLMIDIISGTVEVTADVQLVVPEVMIYVRAGATLRFRKHTNLRDANNILVGEGTYSLRCFSNLINICNEGLIDVEAHTGVYVAGGGNYSRYQKYQGAIAICGNDYVVPHQYQSISLLTYSNITVGTNATLFVNSATGTIEANACLLANYKRRSYSGSGVILGSNAVESTLVGDRIFARAYQPTSTTDPNVSEGEVVQGTNYQLYWKKGGTIRPVGAPRVYHPTSSTDASVWEGEMVVSPSNNNLYVKRSGIIYKYLASAY